MKRREFFLFSKTNKKSIHVTNFYIIACKHCINIKILCIKIYCCIFYIYFERKQEQQKNK